MKKLTLEMDALRVESFVTEHVGAVRGTVHGHDDTVETEDCSVDYTCLDQNTCLPLRTCGVVQDEAEK